METWYAIVERKTGFLLSTGTRVELDKLPGYVDVQVLDHKPTKAEYWSIEDRFFRPRVMEKSIG